MRPRPNSTASRAIITLRLLRKQRPRLAHSVRDSLRSFGAAPRLRPLRCARKGAPQASATRHRHPRKFPRPRPRATTPMTPQPRRPPSRSQPGHRRHARRFDARSVAPQPGLAPLAAPKRARRRPNLNSVGRLLPAARWFTMEVREAPHRQGLRTCLIERRQFHFHRHGEDPHPRRCRSQPQRDLPPPRPHRRGPRPPRRHLHHP